MTLGTDSTDGDLARAIGAPASAETEAAEAELYRRFAPRVRLYGLRHLRDEDAARDLAQQVMLLTIEKLRAGAVRDVDLVASFILGTSRQVAMNLKRREWRRERIRDAFPAPVAVEAAGVEAPGAVDVNRLERCLTRLGDRERSVILLTFYGEKSGPEVGRELRIAPGHVRVIRHRAIERLRHCLASEQGGA